MPDGGTVIYTIGHSNHSPELFLELLQRNEIGTVVDVRSQPYSRYCPHFNRESLRPLLEQAGLSYRFLGDALGGRPEGADFYDEEGHVLYGRVAEAPWFGAALDALASAADSSKTAMLCSEENPTVCHRFLLVGRVLVQQGIDVMHVRGNGTLQSNDEALAEAEGGNSNSRQLSLFAEKEEEPPWRSIRSVLPKSPPASSSSR